MTVDDATKRQISASDPTVSTWLSANAGSGKTRVLTDRVARLLLEEVAPQNILCLTYTKAAASEMQNRLFKRLGEWSMMDDASLTQALADLGSPIQKSNITLGFARTLFARAIDTPGGLRIQTIHSFCASLLRRFPIEAGVSPMFREMEDRAAKILRQEVIEEMAAGEHSGSLRELAAYYSGDDFGSLAAEALRHRQIAERPFLDTNIWAQFDLPPDYSDADILADVFLGSEPDLFKELLPILRSSPLPTDKKTAESFSAIDVVTPDLHSLTALFPLFLYGPKTAAPYGAKTNRLPTKAIREANADLVERLHGFMRRVEGVRETTCRLVAARKTRAFLNFSSQFLPLYEARKTARGWLDFDDLITRTRQLLSNPEVAQWVLFRLDGGLDHILVDEAQDTSPDQWKVVELLAQEFSTGQGARADVTRTIFVVGDLKQSIYSFQGADPLAFERMRHHFSESLAESQQTFFQRSLEHSFRSSSAILNLVDAVFDVSGGDGVGGTPSHLAFYDDLPGRVDLWGVTEKSESVDDKNWFDPTDMLAANDHRVELAENIAKQIKEMEKTGSIPNGRGSFRKIEFDDFLILVQRRSELFHQIIRACKSENLPIAGADRLKIGAELAVKDLLALMSFLALPQDSLSLAVALRSPLFGLSEESLFNLAHNRTQKDLWSALSQQRVEFETIHSQLTDLRNRADFLGPFELLERILTRHNGRSRLLARLGPEAEDGIDALISQTLIYEQQESPSLTGFLIWMDADGIEIKRQVDSASGRIRVMTTHGAKGLESPIVILPDTGDRRAPSQDEIIKDFEGNLMWRVASDMQPLMMKQALTKAKTAHDEEMARLLYVALTRAEKWLIVCASGEVKDAGDSWYRKVENGMLAVNAMSFIAPTGPGLRFEHGTWGPAKAVENQDPKYTNIEVPEWAMAFAEAPAAKTTIVTPSEMSGEKSLSSSDEASDSDSGAKYGRQIHLLLEHLPKHAKESWPGLAAHLLDHSADNASDQEVQILLEEAGRVLNTPAFAHIFGPDSLAEVDISADLTGNDAARVRGTIDRLVISDDRVLVVDFKSNKIVPQHPTETPAGILGQMALYLDAVQQIFPNHQIDLCILWTHDATLMPVPHDIVRAAMM